MRHSKLLGLGLVAGIVVMGLLGLLRAAQSLQWGQGIQLISTIFTLVLGFSYFAFSKERKGWWYRIFVLWAAVLMVSYIGSWFMSGTMSHHVVQTTGGLPPPFIIYCVFLLVFIKEIIKPGATPKLNKKPLPILLGSIAIIFGLVSGMVSFTLATAPPGGPTPVPGGEWGPLGINDTAILGMVVGFLVLFGLSKALSIVTAITGIILFVFIGAEATGLGRISDSAVYLSLFAAGIVCLITRKRAGSRG